MPHTSQHKAQVCFPKPAERPPLKIVGVYDGIGGLIRVNDIWLRLVSRFKNEIYIVGCAWDFTLLRDEQLRKRAARHAGDADLIVLSASGESEPPDYIRHWMNIWLPRKMGRCRALVAALHHEPLVRAAATPLHKYLRHAAQRSGMDFFCNADV